MTDELVGADEIRETDIVFDCPACGKSLAIDYRGAGLNIECTDCGNDVVVPIPEGMEIGDLDSTPEEQETRILNLRKSLAEAEERIQDLELRVDELSERRRALEEGEALAAAGTEAIREKIDVIRSAQAEIYRALDDIAEFVK